MAAMAGLPTELCNIAALDPYLSVASFGITAPEITASAMMLGSSPRKFPRISFASSRCSVSDW